MPTTTRQKKINFLYTSPIFLRFPYYQKTLHYFRTFSYTLWIVTLPCAQSPGFSDICEFFGSLFLSWFILSLDFLRAFEYNMTRERNMVSIISYLHFICDIEYSLWNTPVHMYGQQPCVYQRERKEKARWTLWGQLFGRLSISRRVEKVVGCEIVLSEWVDGVRNCKGIWLRKWSIQLAFFKCYRRYWKSSNRAFYPEILPSNCRHAGWHISYNWRTYNKNIFTHSVTAFSWQYEDIPILVYICTYILAPFCSIFKFSLVKVSSGWREKFITNRKTQNLLCSNWSKNILRSHWNFLLPSNFYTCPLTIIFMHNSFNPTCI